MMQAGAVPVVIYPGLWLPVPILRVGTGNLNQSSAASGSHSESFADRALVRWYIPTFQCTNILAT